MEISKVFDARDSIDEWDGQDPIQTNLNPSKYTIERSFQWSDECQSLVQSLKKGWREGVQIKCSEEYNLLCDRLLRNALKQEITNSKSGRQPDKMFRLAERTIQYDSRPKASDSIVVQRFRFSDSRPKAGDSIWYSDSRPKAGNSIRFQRFQFQSNNKIQDFVRYYPLWW